MPYLKDVAYIRFSLHFDKELAMEEDYSVLVALQENLPKIYSEEALKDLEQYVTRYKEILNHIADTADPKNHTLYSQERVDAIELALRDAKYGHSENQRAKAYTEAKAVTEEGIEAILFHLNNNSKE